MGSENRAQQFLEKERNLYSLGLESCWTLIARKLLGSWQEVEEMSLVSPLQKPHCRKSGKEHRIGNRSWFGIETHTHTGEGNMRTFERKQCEMRELQSKKEDKHSPYWRAGRLINKGDKNGLQIVPIILPTFPVALFVPICQLSLFQVSAATYASH